jgi:hypothetical protein
MINKHGKQTQKSRLPTPILKGLISDFFIGLFTHQSYIDHKHEQRYR